MEQCSVLVPSMDRMWSPACRAPLLVRPGTERVLVREKEPWASSPHVDSDPHTRVGPHLSTTLAGLMRSMVMAGLFRWNPVVREIPRVEPGVLVISTTTGPDMLAAGSSPRRRRNWTRMVVPFCPISLCLAS